MEDQPIPFLQDEPGTLPGHLAPEMSEPDVEYEKPSHVKRTGLFLFRCAVVAAILNIVEGAVDNFQNGNPDGGPLVEDMQGLLRMSDAERAVFLEDYLYRR